jgi:site-specific DNA-cytosine methylase
MSDITWVPHIPLIGGQMLGAEKAFGVPPLAIYSYDGFQANDSHYVNYQNNVKGRGLEYRLLDNGPPIHKVDVVSGTPPCAALSQLNTGQTAEAKGANCAKNEWMYKVFEDAIDLFEAKAVVVENAPALYTNKGRAVANNLFDICNKRGYSLTLYKTSTMYHGIPQARDRTFAIGWKSEKAPIMSWFKRDRKNFKEYLSELHQNSLQQDLVINNKLDDEPYYAFIKARTNENPRDVIIRSGNITAFNYINRAGLLEEANKWMHQVGHERGIKVSEHAIKKFSDNKGIWDSSTHVFDECMNAVIGRNLADTIHPIHDRSLTVREALHMMGFPHDFELVGGLAKMNHIAQNVPVPTSRDIHSEIAKFIRNELPMSGTNYLRQNNHYEKTEYDPLGTGSQNATLEEFFV